MRIPPSMIVMGLVTAVPFGLAIRDTVTHRSSSGDGIDLDGEKRDEREKVAAIERIEREQQAREAKAKEQFIASLYGKTPASMGSFFDGITLGASADSFQTEAARTRTSNAASDGLADVELSVDDTLRAVRIEVHLGDCDGVEAKLNAAWGPSVGGIWLDPATHHRAAFENEGICALQFDQYLEPDAWVTSLPFDQIGKPADKDVESRLPGVGYGLEDTTVTAYAEQGKVVGANVIGYADFDTQRKLRDLLSAKLGKQPVQDEHDPGVWIWNTKLPVKLDGSGASRFSVQIGNQTWQ